MKKLLIIISLHLLILQIGMAQKKTITGTVVEAKDDFPIPGAAVSVPGTTTGTITDFDGKYSLTVPIEATQLMFSFLGMKRQLIAIGERTEINVRLESEDIGLKEVVVTAFGIRREKKALGYAVQELSGDEITQAGQPNIANTLQGRVAGVVIKQASGMPGASALVTIRGIRSLSYNNQPLYVIDGMPIESGSSFENDIEGGTDASSRALDINPDDIETINVLKGPTASALYGLRASNGVVVITTKSGSNAGENKNSTIVSLHTAYTVDKVSRLPDVQTVYGQGSNGQYNPYDAYSWGEKISEMGTYINQIGNEETAAVYDNITPFFQTGNTAQNSIDISGGSDMGNYSLGLGATLQSGIIPTTGMQRYTAKFSGLFSPYSKLKIGASVNYSDVHIDKVPGGSNYSNPLLTTYFAPSSYDLWGKPYEYENDEYSQYNYRYRMDNPRWALAHNKYFEDTKRLFGNIHFTYNPTDWITFTYRIGTDNFTTNGKEILELGSAQTNGRSYPGLGGAYSEPSGGQIDKYVYSQSQINSNASLTFDRIIGDNIHINILLGNELYDIRTNNIMNRGNELMLGGFHNLSNAINYTAFEMNTAQRVVGFFTNMSFEYKSILFLNVSGRNDIVSNMPSGNRSFFYPSIALGFVVSELNFFNKTAFLPYAKIRASVAQVGQAGPIYATQNYYVKGGHTNGFLPGGGYLFPIDGYAGFTAGGSINNPNLVPQNTTTYEAGADLRFFDNKLGIDYTFYKIRATDQIFRVPLPRSTGYIDELRNGGEISTTGHEAILNLTLIDTKNINWNLSSNFSMYHNEVVSLEKGIKRLQVGSKNFPNIGVYAYAGYEFPVIFGTPYLRDNDGNIVVDSRQENSDGSSNPTYGMPLAGAQDVLATVAPDFQFGITNNLTYKQLTLSFLIDIQKGGNMYSGMNALLNAYGMSTETLDRDEDIVLDAVKGYLDDDGNLVVEGENDIAIKKQKIYWDNVLWNITESAVYETSYIRLRNVNLSVALPEKMLSKVNIRSASIYISGRNLLLITDYPNFDPEASTSTGNASGGFEYVALPNAKSIGAGLKISF